METRTIGNSEIRASVIGLGCNNFALLLKKDATKVRAIVHKALDVGITFFDMAGEHGGGMEEVLFADALGGRRHEVVIATKFGQPELMDVVDGELVFNENLQRRGMSRRWIMQAVEESLRRLKTDYIDLFQPHMLDATVPIDETMRALDDLVQQGKVRAIGQAVNNTTANDVVLADDSALAIGSTQFISVQAGYNILNREAEATILPLLRARGMSLIPYSPMANGMLTGKYRLGAPIPAQSRIANVAYVRDAYYTPANLDLVEKLLPFARDRGFTLSQLAVAWLLSEPLVPSVIAGATSADQVAENAGASGKSLSPADRVDLAKLIGR